MAYAKLPLPCGDYPFGKSDFNQMVENHSVFHSTLAAKHGMTPAPAGSFWGQAGRHNDRLICKTFVKILPSVVAGARSVSVLSAPTPAVVSITTPSVGEVSVTLAGIGRRRVIAMAEQDTSTPLRWVSLGWDSGGANFFGGPIGVLLYETDALADFPFYLAIWET